MRARISGSSVRSEGAQVPPQLGKSTAGLEVTRPRGTAPKQSVYACGSNGPAQRLPSLPYRLLFTAGACASGWIPLGAGFAAGAGAASGSGCLAHTSASEGAGCAAISGEGAGGAGGGA